MDLTPWNLQDELIYKMELQEWEIAVTLIW